MRALLLLLCMAATAHADPLTKLRAADFVGARDEAAVALGRNPADSRASIVHAIAAYEDAADRFGVGAIALLDHSTIDAIAGPDGRALWEHLGDSLAGVDADLAVAGSDPAFSLELCLACWEHDWNHTGTIDSRDRRLFEIDYDASGATLPDGDPRRRPTYRFDAGDIDWARAMISFQRAAVELVLAYDWSGLTSLKSGHVTLKLSSAARVRHARELILAGLAFSERCRSEYLAETDDDREWVPSPRQHSYAMPLKVDRALYDTWLGVLGDVRRLLESKDAISLREVASLDGKRTAALVPDAYLDLGAMLRSPTDIVISFDDDKKPTLASITTLLRGALGHGYVTKQKRSPLVARLARMSHEISSGADDIGHKLRYLLWLN